jgi:hypothetical protein
METNFITFTTEISELKLNKLTNSYYFNFKYNITDNEYHTVDLTGYNEYQSEGIRKDFIDMISNMNKIAVDLSKQIENGDILYNSHNIKLEGQKPVNNESFTKETQFTELDLTEFQQEQRLKHIEYNELKVKVKKLSEKNKKLKAKNKKLTKQLRKLTAINTGE